MKLQKIINGTSEDEKALINIDTGKVITSGDEYHNKIDEYISGFLHGLNYASVEYELVDDIEVSPDDELFETCDFYNESFEDEDGCNYHEEDEWGDGDDL